MSAPGCSKREGSLNSETFFLKKQSAKWSGNQLQLLRLWPNHQSCFTYRPISANLPKLTSPHEPTPSPMKTLALTGGIATGKSTAVGFFTELCPGAVVFDCDDSVRGLLGTGTVVARLEEEFGPGLRAGDGTLDRAALREVVFSDPEKRRRLEGILHPLVREECLELCGKVAKTAALFLADVPLLYEGGFDFGQEQSLVVAVSPETQVERLKRRDAFGDELISSILRAQLPIMEKVRRAEAVFWNEGTPDFLRQQVATFLKSLKLI